MTRVRFPACLVTKVTTALLVMFLACPAFSFAAVDVEKYSNQFLDGVDQLVNYTQLRQLRKQLHKSLGVLVNPYFKVGFDLTDNVFQHPGDDKVDTIWTFTPGVIVTVPQPFGKFGFSYEADFRYFTHQSINNVQDQSFAAIADVNLSENVYVRANERLIQRGATAGRVGLEPVDYLDNLFNIVAGYRYGRWGFEAGYENFVRNYQHQLYDRLDYDDNKFTARVLADVAESVRGIMEFNYGIIDFPDVSTRDAGYFEILPGVEGNFPLGMTISANAGVHRRNYDKGARNDLTMFVTNLVLKKQLQPRTGLEVAFLRRPQEGSFDAQTFYDEKLFYAGLNHLITRKLRGKFGMTYANRDFEGVSTVGGVAVKRDDDAFGLNLGLDYAAREWLILHMGYLVERRDSNISDFDYTENRFSLGASMPV